ncbi:MAG: hypothetical protein ACRC7N_01805 [Clostridium sp.]
MKKCPYCKENISYLTLLKYSLGKGFAKEENCPNCNKTYKVTLNLIFTGLVLLFGFAFVFFVMKAESRGESRLYILLALGLLLPLFPIFTNIKELS